jgi:hypothetical protein
MEMGYILPFDPVYVAAREEIVQDLVVPTAEAWRRYGPPEGVIVDNPAKPGYGRWTDGGAWAVQHFRRFEVPLLGWLTLHKDVGILIVMAFAEIRHRCPQYKPIMASTICVRRINRETWRAWSMHCIGIALDVDLDLDGKWERCEDEARFPPEVIAICEGCGLTWGGRWPGKAEDDMHLQIAIA